MKAGLFLLGLAVLVSCTVGVARAQSWTTVGNMTFASTYQDSQTTGLGTVGMPFMLLQTIHLSRFAFQR